MYSFTLWALVDLSLLGTEIRGLSLACRIVVLSCAVYQSWSMVVTFVAFLSYCGGIFFACCASLSVHLSCIVILPSLFFLFFLTKVRSQNKYIIIIIHLDLFHLTNWPIRQSGCGSFVCLWGNLRCKWSPATQVSRCSFFFFFFCCVKVLNLVTRLQLLTHSCLLSAELQLWIGISAFWWTRTREIWMQIFWVSNVNLTWLPNSMNIQSLLTFIQCCILCQ